VDLRHGGPAPSVAAFDPTDDAVQRDPYPAYRILQERDPVHRGAHGVWYVSRHDDVRAVLTDPRFSRAGIRDLWKDLIGPGQLSRIVGDIILFQDEPDHSRLRDVVGSAFTPAALRALEPEIAGTVDSLMAAPRRRGATDVVDDLAYPLALFSILRLLGLPLADADRIGRWSRSVGRTLDRGAAWTDISLGQAAVAEFAGYVDARLAERDHGGRDLLSVMAAARDRGAISTGEIVSTVITFIFTGHETVANQVGNGLWCLLRHPAQLRLVRERPELIDAAVEECLRYEPSVQSNSRQLVTDVELRGHRMSRDDLVVVLAAAANRDPARYERPDEFDLTRPAVSSLAFGAGMRYCLGAYLARVQLRQALGALTRLPGIRLACPEAALVYQRRTMFRGLTSLPVSFTPPA
jgi:cytochrome P450